MANMWDAVQERRKRDAWRRGHSDGLGGFEYRPPGDETLRSDYRQGYEAGERQRKESE